MVSCEDPSGNSMDATLREILLHFLRTCLVYFSRRLIGPRKSDDENDLDTRKRDGVNGK